MEEDHSKRVFQRVPRFVPVAALLILIVSWLAVPVKVRADGGGLPTRTPTRTLVPSFPTPVPTKEPTIIFPPIPTSTQAVGVLGQQDQLLPPNQAIPEVGTAAGQAPSFSLLSCWPFVLVVLLVLVVGVMWLSSRRQSTT